MEPLLAPPSRYPPRRPPFGMVVAGFTIGAFGGLGAEPPSAGRTPLARFWGIFFEKSGMSLGPFLFTETPCERDGVTMQDVPRGARGDEVGSRRQNWHRNLIYITAAPAGIP